MTDKCIFYVTFELQVPFKLKQDFGWMARDNINHEQTPTNTPKKTVSEMCEKRLELAPNMLLEQGLW